MLTISNRFYHPTSFSHSHHHDGASNIKSVSIFGLFRTTRRSGSLRLRSKFKLSAKFLNNRNFSCDFLSLENEQWNVFSTNRSRITMGFELNQLESDDVEIVASLGQLFLRRSIGYQTSLSLDEKENGVNIKLEGEEEKQELRVNIFVAKFKNRVVPEYDGKKIVLLEYSNPIKHLAINEIKIQRRFRETSDWVDAQTSSKFLPLLGWFVSLPRNIYENEVNENDVYIEHDISLLEKNNSKPFTIWLIFSMDCLRPALPFSTASVSPKPSFQFFNNEKKIIAQKKYYLKNLIRRCIECLSFCHVRGIIHGALSSSSFTVSSYNKNDADYLEVKLSSFCFAKNVSTGIDDLEDSTLSFCEQNGAKNALQITNFLRQVDLSHTGIALLEIVFTSLSRQATTGGSDVLNAQKNSANSLWRLWRQVFHLDAATLREYCVQDGDWEDVVEFLDEKDRSGWKLFCDLLGFVGKEANEYADSPFLA